MKRHPTEFFLEQKRWLDRKNDGYDPPSSWLFLAQCIEEGLMDAPSIETIMEDDPKFAAWFMRLTERGAT